MKNTKRILLAAAAALLLVAVSVGGTLAWLTDSTETVTNTFAPAGIDIDIFEHKYDGSALDNTEEVKQNNNYKLVPGNVLPKDPFVRVKADSEPCYIFVKIEETNIQNFVTYAVDDDKWTFVETGVYMYKEKVATSSTNRDLYILKGNQVVVKENVTYGDMHPTEGTFTNPVLKFTAYAVQSENLTVSTPEEIWGLVNPTPAP